ncbi:patatin-like phospholipase protein [Ceratobasidium sp. AG-Ba]|nr:patatin-like phospholipase protein [Ceratobasidium sp. AG-Ba]
MMCGTGTSGLAAIMVGRLRMPIEKAILAYISLMESAFSRKKWWKSEEWDSGRLQRAIDIMIGANMPVDWFHRGLYPSTLRDKKKCRELNGEYEPMLEFGRYVKCRVFVTTTFKEDSPSCTRRLRTYCSGNDPLYYCTISEVLRATTVEPHLTEPLRMRLRWSGSKRRMFTASSGCASPTIQLIEEAARDLRGYRVACIISLGTGHPHTICEGTPRLHASRTAKVLRQIAADCEETYLKLAPLYEDHNVYFRFNIDREFRKVGVEEWNYPEEVQKCTLEYMEQTEVARDIENLVRILLDYCSKI